MTRRERAILRHYFEADMNAKIAARRIGLSAERVRQVVRQIQEDYGCTRIQLAAIIDPPTAKRPRRPRLADGQEALW